MAASHRIFPTKAEWLGKLHGETPLSSQTPTASGGLRLTPNPPYGYAKHERPGCLFFWLLFFAKKYYLGKEK